MSEEKYSNKRIDVLDALREFKMLCDELEMHFKDEVLELIEDLNKEEENV